MMAISEIPDWALSKDEQKRRLENHVCIFLAANASTLAPHQRFFLSETIGLIVRGLFGMARASMANAYEDAGKFDHYAMDQEVVARASPSNLHLALLCLEGAPAQKRPIFR